MLHGIELLAKIKRRKNISAKIRIKMDTNSICKTKRFREPVKSTYECQFRFITPTTRPDGRLETGHVSPAESCDWAVVLGASSALPGTRWTPSSSSSSVREYGVQIYSLKEYNKKKTKSRKRKAWQKKGHFRNAKVLNISPRNLAKQLLTGSLR